MPDAKTDAKLQDAILVYCRLALDMWISAENLKSEELTVRVAVSFFVKIFSLFELDKPGEK